MPDYGQQALFGPEAREVVHLGGGARWRVSQPAMLLAGLGPWWHRVPGQQRAGAAAACRRAVRCWLP